MLPPFFFFEERGKFERGGERNIMAADSVPRTVFLPISRSNVMGNSVWPRFVESSELCQSFAESTVLFGVKVVRPNLPVLFLAAMYDGSISVDFPIVMLLDC